MNKEQFAEKYNGVEYQSPAFNEMMKAPDSVLVIFGQGDDIVSFRGLFRDDEYCYTSTGQLPIMAGGQFYTFEDLIESDFSESLFQRYFDNKGREKMVTAKCGEDGFIFTCDIPNAKFYVMGDGERLYTALVIDAADVPVEIK